MTPELYPCLSELVANTMCWDTYGEHIPGAIIHPLGDEEVSNRGLVSLLVLLSSFPLACS